MADPQVPLQVQISTPNLANGAVSLASVWQLPIGEKHGVEEKLHPFFPGRGQNTMDMWVSGVPLYCLPGHNGERKRGWRWPAKQKYINPSGFKARLIHRLFEELRLK